MAVKRGYTAAERKAYWIGVGISAALHGDSENLLKSADASLKKSLLRGYEDDNVKDLSRKTITRKRR